MVRGSARACPIFAPQRLFVAGGGFSTNVVLTLGFANLIADGISMALGDYLSSKAEYDLAAQERKRELWEYDNNPEGEKSEMVEMLEGKGIEKADAVRIIDVIAKNRTFFVDFMVWAARACRGPAIPLE